MIELDLQMCRSSWGGILRPLAPGRKGLVHKNDAISGEKKLLEITVF
jgi:hypothetical protein